MRLAYQRKVRKPVTAKAQRVESKRVRREVQPSLREIVIAFGEVVGEVLVSMIATYGVFHLIVLKASITILQSFSGMSSWLAGITK